MNSSLLRMSGALERMLAIPARWRVGRWAALLPAIEAAEGKVRSLGDREMTRLAMSFRYRAKAREPLDRLLPEVYALVREAARRTVGMRHFDVQVLGGIAMFQRSIVEMQTGEGKTLAATLPMCLYALAGKGCHLATANDYLAKRDAEWMGPIYTAMGLSVGVVLPEMTNAQRRAAYACDVTYGTAKEFGFDFLRDRLLGRRVRDGRNDLVGRLLDAAEEGDDRPMQREPYFALVDEADSVLIDEARTPLFISVDEAGGRKQASECFRWAAKVAGEFEEKRDYKYDHKERSVELTRAGRHKVRPLPRPGELARVGMPDLYEYVERAIKVRREFSRDQEFLVRDGKVVIVDEFTGRTAEGRMWMGGIQQAVEAKEGLAISTENGQAARVTVQDFFLRYERLAGMTGTAVSSARELRRIYPCRVVAVPPNRPPVREALPTLVYPGADAKWAAVADEISRVHATGRPVLIGTRSVDKSEHLSKLLADRAIEHQVLNAKQHAEEANVVAQAGQRDRVTVSTNMAGRGTDIRLADGVAELGGLHVICTEMHESARIDRQLIGRCGRQGDPGSYRQFLALDDELIETAFGPEKAQRLCKAGKAGGRLQACVPLFRRAQKTVERRHLRERRKLIYFERHRRRMYRQIGQDPCLDGPSR
ncbi:MAG: helicase-related protein [Thermoguttaceae bacterium]